MLAVALAVVVFAAAESYCGGVVVVMCCGVVGSGDVCLFVGAKGGGCGCGLFGRWW